MWKRFAPVSPTAVISKSLAPAPGEAAADIPLTEAERAWLRELPMKVISCLIDLPWEKRATMVTMHRPLLIEHVGAALKQLYQERSTAFHGYLENKGLFVTLHEKKKLKGCLGCYAGEGDDFFNQLVQLTISTVMNDQRFDDDPPTLRRMLTSPFSSSALSDHVFTLTVISPAFDAGPLTDFWSKYKPCLHGITAHFRDGKQATYLPTVVLDQKWLRECKQPSGAAAKQQFELTVFGSLFDKSHGHTLGMTQSNKYKQVEKIELYEAHVV